MARIPVTYKFASSGSPSWELPNSTIGDQVPSIRPASFQHARIIALRYTPARPRALILHVIARYLRVTPSASFFHFLNPRRTTCHNAVPLPPAHGVRSFPTASRNIALRAAYSTEASATTEGGHRWCVLALLFLTFFLTPTLFDRAISPQPKLPRAQTAVRMQGTHDLRRVRGRGPPAPRLPEPHLKRIEALSSAPIKRFRCGGEGHILKE
ncbi:hypothetical protein K438DRAFT_1996200 [Mycena galopus ATCC 62051]|nr:hypothetical protein K438DRAFT_1996200 [Mycena galopus ATCC 62051]